uniref:Uncharacterized protein n=1 Tax=Athene cunicularia TaxID=194338 RepID=A0A663M156_ATHCN
VRFVGGLFVFLKDHSTVKVHTNTIFVCFTCSIFSSLLFLFFLTNLLGDKIEEDDSESRLSRRGQPQTEEDAYLKLQSKVTSSLVRIANIRAKLTSLQALEGSRELVNIDVSDLPCILSDEMQRTQELMSQAEELQLLKKNHGKLPAQGKKLIFITPV